MQRGLSLLSLALLTCNSTKTTPHASPAPADAPPARARPSAPPPKLEELEPGVFFREQVLSRPSGEMRLWLYAPARKLEGPVGCVVVPPAGSNLISGMRLSDGDRAEHIPYVRAGYVVVSFDIEGAMSPSAGSAAALASITAFREAEAGVANARAALDAALSSRDPR